MGKSEVVLVTGGARSGKSSFAERLARESNLEVVYVATSEVKDEEMALRVKKHRAQRPRHWYTIEEPLHPEKEIEGIKGQSKIILLDCLTLWVSNLLLHPELPYAGAGFTEKETYILEKTKKLIELFFEKKYNAILVSNEVGWGVVPDNPLARAYRDIAGRVNQLCAGYASRVYLTVAGLPVELKQLSASVTATLQKKGDLNDG